MQRGLGDASDMNGIDVVIPCYQYGRYLRECVTSVLAEPVGNIRILIIDNGTIVAEGTPAELKKRVSGDAITLTMRSETDATRAVEIAGALDGADTPQIEAHVVRPRRYVTVVLEGDTEPDAVLAGLLEADGVDVTRRRIGKRDGRPVLQLVLRGRPGTDLDRALVVLAARADVRDLTDGEVG